MADLSGRQFGSYQIIEPLGEGGMAVVYKAYQPTMERYVALKVLPHALAEEPEFVGRFRQEARLLANLQHPHILPIFDFGEIDGVTYIVMPYIKSGTLADLMTGQPLDLERATRMTTQIADALDYAHKRGLVHRDIKPSNILIDEGGNCLLTDFGIAKLFEATTGFTSTGGIIGTPSYMSPEQGQGERVDQCSDIYSLGVVFFEMVTGRVPFTADTPIAVVLRHITDPLPAPRALNPAIPDLVERVILKATAKNPRDRFQDTASMARALRSGDAETVVVPPAPEPMPRPEPELVTPVAASRPQSSARLKWIILGAIALVLVALASGAGLFLLLQPDPTPNAPVAGNATDEPGGELEGEPVETETTELTELTEVSAGDSTLTVATAKPEATAILTPVGDNVIRIDIDGTTSRTEVVAVSAGQVLRVTVVDGAWRAGPAPAWPDVQAAGDARTPEKASFPVPTAPLMALVGGIGDGEPFLVQPGEEIAVTQDGMMWMGPNDDDPSDNGGALILDIEVAEGPAVAEGATVEATEAATATSEATATPDHTPTPAATAPPLGPETIVVGHSVEGIPIEAVRFGNGPNVVVFVGGIHAGFAPSSVRVAQNAVQHFTENPEDVPESATVYVIISMNPDSVFDPGRVPGRLNANGVDLNRNWECAWARNPEIDNNRVNGAGGAAPFSEPETVAVSEFLLEVEARAVVFWEARAVPGLVLPGACGPDSQHSNPLATTYANPSGYRWSVIQGASGIDVNGDASNWLDQQGIASVFVLMPNFTEVDWDNNLRGMLGVIRAYGR